MAGQYPYLPRCLDTAFALSDTCYVMLASCSLKSGFLEPNPAASGPWGDKTAA